MAITWANSERVDMRVGIVVDAQPFPEARRPALKLWIDVGPLGVKRARAPRSRSATRLLCSWAGA